MPGRRAEPEAGSVLPSMAPLPRVLRFALPHIAQKTGSSRNAAEMMSMYRAK